MSEVKKPIGEEVSEVDMYEIQFSHVGVRRHHIRDGHCCRCAVEARTMLRVPAWNESMQASFWPPSDPRTPLGVKKKTCV